MGRFLRLGFCLIWMSTTVSAAPLEFEANDESFNNSTTAPEDVIIVEDEIREGYVRWGDMIVPKDFLSNIGSQNAIPSDSKRWPNGVVTYKIDPSLSSIRSLILKAMAHYEANTCIRFKETSSTSGNYLYFFQGQGCYTYVGMSGGKQPLSLGNGCKYIGTAVHEIGHALGFYHEQSRSDRDDYINIYWQNIQQGMSSQFQILRPNQNRLYNNFDYNSIMIYGETAFSKDGRSKTMEDKTRKHKLTEPYSKQGMSANDIQRVRKLYNCQ